jgi:hypothetical protein
MKDRSTPPAQALDEWNRRLGVSLDASESTGLTCVGCGEEMPEFGSRVLEFPDIAGFCKGCEDRSPFELQSLDSGAVCWSCPSHCPSVRKGREHYVGFDDCSCDYGRAWEIKEYMGFSTGRHPVQCIVCRDRHVNHPGVAEKMKITHLSQLVRSNWERRMCAEHLRRLHDSGIKSMNSDTTGKVSRVREISREVIKEGPSMPQGKSYARFPKGWALDPGIT